MAVPLLLPVPTGGTWNHGFKRGAVAEGVSSATDDIGRLAVEQGPATARSAENG